MPKFAQCGQIAQDERAAAERRFQNGEAEWLVPCRSSVNRGARKMLRNAVRGKFAQVLRAAQMAITRDLDRPFQLWRDPIEQCDILRIIPNTACRKNGSILLSCLEGVRSAGVPDRCAAQLQRV